MLKTILMRLFGSGHIPTPVRAHLEREGLDILEEGLWGSVTLRNYRSPQRIASWARRSALGAIAISRRRIVVYANSACWIDLPVENPALRALTVTVENTRLAIAFEAAALFPDRSGGVTLRFNFPHADHIGQRLQQHITASQPATE